MLAYETNIDGWTVRTAIEENRPNDWAHGDQVLYSARGTAEFLSPQRNRGQWKSIKRLCYPEGKTQKLFETASAAHDDALKFLTAEIDCQRA
jgi:hypothetical protein